jgi:hypothetical protein
MKRTTKKAIRSTLLLFCTLMLAGQAIATPVFVGAWQVYNDAAPEWTIDAPTGPLAYTAQEAAALLFGGSPGDYAISTVDDDPANIDHLAWYDVIGVGAAIFTEDYSKKHLGLYYGPNDSYDCCGPDYLLTNAASAFVRDNFVDGWNYAFRVAVPEPETAPLLILGLALTLLARRRRWPHGVAASLTD